MAISSSGVLASTKEIEPSCRSSSSTSFASTLSSDKGKSPTIGISITCCWNSTWETLTGSMPAGKVAILSTRSFTLSSTSVNSALVSISSVTAPPPRNARETVRLISVMSFTASSTLMKILSSIS